MIFWLKKIVEKKKRRLHGRRFFLEGNRLPHNQLLYAPRVLRHHLEEV